MELEKMYKHGTKKMIKKYGINREMWSRRKVNIS